MRNKCFWSILLTLAIVPQAPATLYDVNRTFSSGSTTATLVGTVDVPLGNYTIQNASSSPFTAVNLTLTVNGTSYAVNNVLTGLIYGTGQFKISATLANLIFDTANADGLNPADLVFSDNANPSANNRYVIGYNGVPGFEAAYTGAGNVPVTLQLPAVFGVAAVPEPTTCLAGGATLLMLGVSLLRRRS